MEQCNAVSLTGTISKIYPVVSTPTGVKISRFILEHNSEQFEAGLKRSVRCKIFCVYVAGQLRPEKLSTAVKVQGFLSVNAQQELVLHITTIQD